MDDGEGADVVPIHPGRDLVDEDAPVSADPQGRWCLHRRVSLDTVAHKVVCKECDREVDAFEVLRKLANDWQRYATHRKEAERRANAAQARLDETLRLERNARARVGRLDPEVKLPERPWGDASGR